MPYVLFRNENAEIFACMQTNKYDLPYYGVLHRDLIEELEVAIDAVQTAHQSDWRNDWIIREADEAQVKIWNVKLRNDPKLCLFLDEDGHAVAVRRQ